MKTKSIFHRALLVGVWSSGVLSFVAGWPNLWAEDRDEGAPAEENGQRATESLPADEREALGRARWIHEVMHGALQVMHRDYFGDGNDGDSGFLTLPSQSLEDVFKEMARSWKVEIRWLGVNATKDVDHEPVDDFERNAAAVLSKGGEEFSAIERERFRYVGAIQLQNECLKCHVPNRRSLEDRVAGLAISFPLAVLENKEH